MVDLLDSSAINLNLTGLTNILPIGAIIFWPSNNIPMNWKICNGQLLDATIYSELYSILGWKFPQSGGTFNLPNFEQSIACGNASALGEKGGSIYHNHSIESHNHTAPNHGHTLIDHQHGMSHSHSAPHNHTWSHTHSGYHSHDVNHSHSSNSSSTSNLIGASYGIWLYAAGVNHYHGVNYNGFSGTWSWANYGNPIVSNEQIQYSTQQTINMSTLGFTSAPLLTSQPSSLNSISSSTNQNPIIPHIALHYIIKVK